MKKHLTKIAQGTAAATASLLAAGQLFLVQAVDVTRGEKIQTGEGYASNIVTIINFALRVVMVIAILLVFGYLIMGGLEWISSGGDKGKTESARNKITAAIVGLIILAASYAILTLVLNYLGFSGGLEGALDSVPVIR